MQLNEEKNLQQILSKGENYTWYKKEWEATVYDKKRANRELNTKMRTQIGTSNGTLRLLSIISCVLIKCFEDLCKSWKM